MKEPVSNPPINEVKTTVDKLRHAATTASDPATDSATATGTHLAPGTLIAGRYRVIGLLGEGGMGSVYRVKQILLDRDFALKTININTVSESAWRRFQKEAKAAAALDNPAIVKVHDFGESEDGNPFFAMDLVEGTTLSRLIKKGPLPLDMVLETFGQLCFGLGYAHSQGIVHRDIKPSNIMVSDADGPACDLKIKIVDFGIAKVLGIHDPETEALTLTGEIFGTPYYMSPEQCLGKGVDDRSDIYSVGCVLFEALTGTPPFMGETPLSTMMMHQSESPPSLKEASLGRAFPPGLQEVVSKLLQKDPRDRYQSLTMVGADLARVKANEPVTLGYHTDQLQGLTPHASDADRKAAVLSALIVLLLAACGIGFFVGQRTADRGHGTVDPPTGEPFKVFVKSGKVPIEKPATQPFSGYFSTPGPGKSFRLFNFPKEQLGYLSIPKDSHAFVSINGIFRPSARPPAMGTVMIDDFSPLTLDVDRCIKQSQLRGFRPDELSGLCFEKNSRGLNDSLTDIEHLRSLRVLRIRSASFLTDDCIDSINKLPNLESLYFGRSRVTPAGIQRLSRLKHLKSFGLEEFVNADKILPMLPHDLTELTLKRCELKGSTLEELRPLSALKYLDITDNPDISDADLTPLSALHHLERLNMVAPKKITVSGLRPLSDLPLQVLWVTKNQFSPDELKELQRIFPKCLISVVTPSEHAWSDQRETGKLY